MNEASNEIPRQYLDCSRAHGMMSWRPRWAVQASRVAQMCVEITKESLRTNVSVRDRHIPISPHPHIPFDVGWK
jgi:hypothetical protein